MDKKQKVEAEVETKQMANPQCDQMLLEFLRLQFTEIELTLYLDTHPDDQEALNTYNSIVPQLKQCLEACERIYGPLRPYGNATSQCPWQWINSPWPWEL